MVKKIIKITFKNKSDFRNRIARLWQVQKEDEEYEFIFPDEETEIEFENLILSFVEDDDKIKIR